MLVDIIIPVASYHRDVAQSAIDSAHAQTLPANVIVIEDSQRRGKAWARNTGIRAGQALFITFLDADDLLDPRFTAKTVAAYRRGHYVFTDWTLGGKALCTADPCRAIWQSGMSHIITTLIPRAAVEHIRGFDESLLALEDEDFYYRLQGAGICPAHVPEALVNYRRALGHGAMNAETADPERRARLDRQMSDYFRTKYGRRKSMCNCNGSPPTPTPAGEKYEGDILVAANYSPMSKIGPVSGRKYARTGLGKPLWVDPRDVAARPDWWEPSAAELTPDVDTVQALALEALRDAV